MSFSTKTSVVATAIVALVALPVAAASAYGAINTASVATAITQEALQPVPVSQGVNIDETAQATAKEAAHQYVRSSRKVWQANYESAYWTKQHEVILDQVQSAKFDVEKRKTVAEEAAQKAEESRKVVASWARESARGGNQIPNTVEVLLNGPSSMTEILDSHQAEEIVAQKVADISNQAEVDKKAADLAKDAAQAESDRLEALSKEADASLKTAQEAATASQAEMVNAQTAWTDAWRALSKTSSDTSTDIPTIGNQILNQALIEEWNTYLTELSALGVTIPTADQLVNTNKYPEGLAPAKAVNILDTTGVSSVNGVIVPSQEAIQRTSKALEQLGKPYADNGDGSNGWGCTEFTNAMVGTTGSLSESYMNQGRQNHVINDTQTGDIVFFADPQAGIHQASIYVFGGFVVNASAASGFVSAEQLGVDALASVRPGTHGITNTPAPVAVPGALPWKCGGIAGLDDSATSAGGWITPLAEGEYTKGAEYTAAADARFGAAGSPGLEFVSGEPKPIKADFDGTVTEIVEDPVWGTTLTIQHSETLTSRYSSLSAASVVAGSAVTGGQIIGVTGTTGSAANPQNAVLVTINSSGNTVDPKTMFFPEREGQFSNGQIPASALCQVKGGGLLRCDAARSYEVMAAAYEADLGTPLTASDTYRSFEGQVICRANKGDLCAVPGTSNHGWGLAVDFGGGIQDFSSAQHKWMVENAAKYGWHHPEWARANGSKPEAWHWEFFTTK